MSVTMLRYPILKSSDEEIKRFSAKEILYFVSQYIDYTRELTRLVCDMDEADENAMQMVLEEAREDAWSHIGLARN